MEGELVDCNEMKKNKIVSKIPMSEFNVANYTMAYEFKIQLEKQQSKIGSRYYRGDSMARCTTKNKMKLKCAPYVEREMERVSLMKLQKNEFTSIYLISCRMKRERAHT